MRLEGGRREGGSDRGMRQRRVKKGGCSAHAAHKRTQVLYGVLLVLERGDNSVNGGV